jgi:hypothetical protein
MNQILFSNWLAAKKTLAGLLALVVYSPGEPALIENCGASKPDTSFDTAWRSVAETIPVLQLNDFPTGCFRFVFQQALIHCERRRDGICIGVFVRRGEEQLPSEELEQLLAEFHAL